MNHNAEAEKTLISVVMPVYNASRFLRQAVESVLCQSYENLELIAVDDCSTDNSIDILHEYAEKDFRVHVLCSEKNQGVAHVRNRGIEAAKGAYIALLDSDDVWVNTKLERQLSLFTAKDIDIAYCSLDFVDENDQPIKRPFIVPLETSYEKMLVKCAFTCSTIMVKSDLLKAHPFKSQYYHEDFLLWMELMAVPAKAAGDPEVLMHNRQVIGSRSNSKIHAARHRWEIYRKALNLGFLKSCVVFVLYAFNGIVKYYT